MVPPAPGPITLASSTCPAWSASASEGGLRKSVATCGIAGICIEIDIRIGSGLTRSALRPNR